MKIKIKRYTVTDKITQERFRFFREKNAYKKAWEIEENLRHPYTIVKL